VKGASLVGRYSKELRGKFGLWPTWLPDAPLVVGDFGRVEKGVFLREGHIGDLGVGLQTAEPQAHSDQLFASRGVRHVLLDGGMSEATAGTARARIDFGRGFGVFVALRKCREERAADMITLANQMARCKEDGRWTDRHCLVTSVMKAQSALIAIDSDGGGSLELTANAPASDLLTLLGGEAKIASESSVGYRSLVSAGCTPLLRLSRLSAKGDLLMRGNPTPAPRLLALDPRVGLEAPV